MRILDSDHCVAILRGLLDLRGRVAADEALAVTAVSVAELTHGAQHPEHGRNRGGRMRYQSGAAFRRVLEDRLRAFVALVLRDEATGM